MRGVKEQGRKAVLIAGDIGDISFCKEVVKQTIKQFGRIDVLVNNAAEQHPLEKMEYCSPCNEYYMLKSADYHGACG